MVKPSSTKVEAAPISTMKKPLKKSKREAEDDMDIPKKQKKELIASVHKEKALPKNVDSSDSEEEDKEITSIKKPIATAESSSSSDESSDEEPAPAKKQPASLKKAKAENISEDESSSDEEPAPAKKQPTVVKQAKAESSSSEDESSSSDEETAPAKKKPTVVTEAKADKSSSEDESSEDEEPTPAKKQPIVVKNAKLAEKDSSSSEEDSDDEESDDEKPPTKKAKVSVTKTCKQESSSDESDKEESEDEKVTPKKKDSDIEMVEAEQKPIAKQPKTPTTQTQGGSKTLFVGNLSYNVERSDLENFFKEVVDVRFTSDEDGKFKGYGHVEFATAEAAQKALELNRTSLLGREVRLDFAREKAAFNTPRSSNARNYESGEKGVGSQSKTIYVKGFDTSIGEDEIKSDLRAHFGACGEVSRIVLPTDHESGDIKGIAFIDLKDGYDKALKLRGSEIRGRKVDVREAKPRGNSGDDSAVGFSNNKRGRGPRGRDSNRGVRGPRGRSQGRGPPGRGPSKPSLIASAQGKKTVFKDDE